MRHPLALRATAYHEAGHAVAAWAMGVPVRIATIVPEGDYGGLVRTGSMPAAQSALRQLEGRAIISAAGPAAQRLYAPRSGVRHGAVFDMMKLDALGEAFFLKRDDAFPDEDRKRPFFRLVARQARALMAEHWVAVHRVAAALLASRALSGFAIDRLCCEAAEEWAQVSCYVGLSPLDYVRREIEATKPRPSLTRAAIAAATLRAVTAGAPDIRTAALADLSRRGFPEPECRAAWERITADGAST